MRLTKDRKGVKVFSVATESGICIQLKPGAYVGWPQVFDIAKRSKGYSSVAAR